MDRNQPPETWITAAPQDTITLKDANGIPLPIDPKQHTIPVRFHMYWAGSDRDGAVVGYYWAVVETTITSIEGGVPPLPGPKPSDYRFTTRTDSTFVFNVTEQITDREHAFYIYAVDNQGKVDATPARFTFIANDRFPPRPVMEVALATGEIVLQPDPSNPVLQRVSVSTTVTDTLPPPARYYEPRDTVANQSRMDFRWHADVTLAGTVVTGFRYKMDEPAFQSMTATPESASYSVTYLPPIQSGVKVFTLRALDQAGGAGETTRRFYMNYAPDTWWSGPDQALFPPTDDQTLNIGVRGRVDGQSILINDWSRGGPGVPGTYLGPDSLRDRPVFRPRRRTFYEIWKGRVWARSEGDTVHLNSWVVFWNGGYDKDSRYIVRADTTDPQLQHPPGTILQGDVLRAENDLTASPIGFRSKMTQRLDFGGESSAPQSGLYPVWEPASVFRAPRVGSYNRMLFSGKVYATVSAEDADGARDNSVSSPTLVGETGSCDEQGTDQEKLRCKVLVFYANKSPWLLTTNSQFTPRQGQIFNSRSWSLNMLATDLDPYDRSAAGAQPGGPTGTPILRFKITLLGKDFTTGRDTTYLHPGVANSGYVKIPTNQSTFLMPITVPCYLASGPITVRVELCDCTECESSPGAGRCVTESINVTYTRPTTGCPEPGVEPVGMDIRPGSDPSGRSQ